MYPFNASLQVAPFWQGRETHSLISDWQSEPEKPGAHTHERLVPLFIQVAPLRQYVKEHSVMLIAQVAVANPAAQLHENLE